MKNSFNLFWGGDRLDMNSTFRQFSMAAVAIAVMQVASAQVTMTHVLPMQIAGQGTEIRVMFNGVPPQPKAYQLADPARLILDFAQAKETVGKASIPVATADVVSVDVASDENRARLTINLNKMGSYTTRVEDNVLILKVNAPTAKSNSVQSTISPNQSSSAAATVQGLSNIDFHRGSAGEGQILLSLLGANTPVDVQQQGSRVVVRLLGNKIPTHLIRRLNVNDFATPVSTIDAYNEGSNGVITIHSTGSYEYMAFQAENKLTISLKKPEDKQSNQIPLSENRYIGNKISLDFQDIEVRRVLQLLADFTNINMVASDSVGGNITLRLKDVPWDQALDIILKTKNLDKRRNGNVMWIAPVTELVKAEEEEAKAIAQSIKLAPIQTEYIQLSYAKAADILKLIEDSRDSSQSDSNRTANSNNLALESLLSSRGSAVADLRTNTIIVNDTVQNIDKIRRMIDLLDVSIKQVMVEARIVRATTDFTKEMGVKWGVSGIVNPFKNGDVLVGGSDQTLWDIKTPDDDGTVTITRPDNLNVDLGVAGAAGKIAFGLINMSNFMLDLELSALQSDGYGEVISTPKVLTADKQNAKVASGTQIPYQSAEGGGQNAVSKTEFIDATLSLDVTPSITPDGKIQMELNITSDTPGLATPTGQLTINKNSINTKVLVNDGETVVLGGIFEQETRNTVTKVPFLGDLPYLKHLFRKDNKSDSRRELLIFVTPRIVNDSPTRNH